MTHYFASLDQRKCFIATLILSVIALILLGGSLWFTFIHEDYRTVAGFLAWDWAPFYLLGFLRGRLYPHKD